MKTIAATELARNLRKVLDCMVHDGEEIAIERNYQQIARLVPGPRLQTALEAMADLSGHCLPRPPAVGSRTVESIRAGAGLIKECMIHGIHNRYLHLDRCRARGLGTRGCSVVDRRCAGFSLSGHPCGT